MADPEKLEHPEDNFDDLSLDELLRGAREEIARVDAMMGGAADEPAQEPERPEAGAEAPARSLPPRSGRGCRWEAKNAEKGFPEGSYRIP